MDGTSEGSQRFFSAKDYRRDISTISIIRSSIRSSGFQARAIVRVDFSNFLEMLYSTFMRVCLTVKGVIGEKTREVVDCNQGVMAW